LLVEILFSGLVENFLDSFFFPDRSGIHTKVREKIRNTYIVGPKTATFYGIKLIIDPVFVTEIS